MGLGVRGGTRGSGLGLGWAATSKAGNGLRVQVTGCHVNVKKLAATLSDFLTVGPPISGLFEGTLGGVSVSRICGRERCSHLRVAKPERWPALPSCRRAWMTVTRTHGEWTRRRMTDRRSATLIGKAPPAGSLQSPFFAIAGVGFELNLECWLKWATKWVL